MEDDDFMHVPEELLAPKETVSKATGLAGAITASMAKWARKPADLYPTPPDCVYSLVPHIESFLPRGRTLLEPACAEGKISRALQACGYATADYDLRPDCGYGTGGVDFLDRANEFRIVDEFDGGRTEQEYAAVFTNPPFAAADEFIRRGLEVSPVVILLLKSNYFHVKKRLGLWVEHTPEWEFKLTWRPAFLEEERGKSPLMDCSWFVFNRDWGEEYTKARPIERVLEPPMDYNGL